MITPRQGIAMMETLLARPTEDPPQDKDGTKMLFVPACLDGYHPVPFVPRRRCLWCTNPECYLVKSLIDRSRLLD